MYKNIEGAEGPVFMEAKRYSLQPKTMPSSGDDDLGHDCAMSYDVRKVKLHGKGGWPLEKDDSKKFGRV
jgi:hypothetical protein